VPLDGSSNNFSSSAPGQYTYVNFAGTAGQSLSVALSNIVLSPTSSALYFAINSPSGSYFNSATCYTSASGCEIHLRNLPTTGTYTLIAEPSYQMTSFTARLSADVTGTLSSGEPLNVNLASSGQSATLGFTLSSAQTVAVNLGSIAVTPAGTSLTLSVYNSSNAQVGTPVSTSTGATVNVTNLAAGTYSVLVTPAIPVTGSLQVGYQ
jgi:hypothetical protein